MTTSLHQVAKYVNTACSYLGATICSMDTIEKRQGNRLKEARIAAGFTKSAAQAAAAFGWAQSTYRTHEAGTRTIGRDDAEKYTRAFCSLGSKITAESVLFPDGKTPKERANPETADEAYERGWREAMAQIAHITQRERPPSNATTLAQKPRLRRTK